MDRKDASPRYRWDLTALYPTDEAFHRDLSRLGSLAEAFPALREGMMRSGEALLSTLEADTEISRLLEHLGEYAMLASDLDRGDNSRQALLSLVEDAENLAARATYFLSSELCRPEDEELARLFSECPALEAYRRTIEGARRFRPHLLGDKEEALLASVRPALGSHREIYSIFTNADMDFGHVTNEKGERVPLTAASYGLLLQSPDRAVRRRAFRGMYKGYRQFGNTVAALYAARVKERVTLARLRGFAPGCEESMFHDEADPAIYRTLIETVGENLEPLFDYYRLKRSVLGLSELHMYDLYLPLLPEASGDYPYDEAVKTVLSSLAPLGEDYVSRLRRGLLEEGWVDVYPGRGKRSGAYSAGGYDTAPYILLNYTGKLDDISTLAHEAGHSMHTLYAKENNSFQDYRYTIFVAEVASTVNELLLTHTLERKAQTREEKLALLNHLMEIYKGTLFRQTMFAEFEEKVHLLAGEGVPLTDTRLSEEYRGVVEKYFGDTVVIDPEISSEWKRIPHFYSCFYVYKYATCISAASAIVKRLESEEGYLEQYLEFLKTGNRLSPPESLLLAGIDLKDPAVIRAAISDFSRAVRDFRTLY